MSFLALIALLYTLMLQSRQLKISTEELKESRKEVQRSADALAQQSEHLEKQVFESTFFKMCESLWAIRGKVKYGYNDRKKLEFSGVEAIEGYARFFEHDSSFNINVNDERSDEEEVEILNDAYCDYYVKQLDSQFGHYFRMLYSILKFIDRSASDNDRHFYSNILRAQLSRYELTMIFYNSLSSYGKDKMLPLVKRYNLLKHLEKNTLQQRHYKLTRLINS